MRTSLLSRVQGRDISFRFLIEWTDDGVPLFWTDEVDGVTLFWTETGKAPWVPAEPASD